MTSAQGRSPPSNIKSSYVSLSLTCVRACDQSTIDKAAASSRAASCKSRRLSHPRAIANRAASVSLASAGRNSFSKSRSVLLIAVCACRKEDKRIREALRVARRRLEAPITPCFAATLRLTRAGACCGGEGGSCRTLSCGGVDSACTTSTVQGELAIGGGDGDGDSLTNAVLLRRSRAASSPKDCSRTCRVDRGLLVVGPRLVEPTLSAGTNSSVATPSPSPSTPPSPTNLGWDRTWRSNPLQLSKLSWDFIILQKAEATASQQRRSIGRPSPHTMGPTCGSRRRTQQQFTDKDVRAVPAHVGTPAPRGRERCA